MNRVTSALLLLFLCFAAKSQAQVQHGEVTYVSAAHLYVQWEDADAFVGADSLLIDGTPHFIVARSTRSVVVEKGAQEFAVGALLTIAPVGVPVPSAPESTEPTDGSALDQGALDANTAAEATEPETEKKREKPSNSLRGRVGTSLLANLDGGTSMLRTSHRLDLGADLQTGALAQSVDLRGTLRQYTTSKDSYWRRNIFQASYSLEGKNVEAQLGRFVPKFAGAMGAMDGMRMSYNGPVALHVLGGFRPNYQTYGFQLDQPMYGVFASTPRVLGGIKLYATMGWANYLATDISGTRGTDRSMLYQQVSLQLAPKVQWFTSLEWDLFKQPENSSAQWGLFPTAVYSSLRFKTGSKHQWFVSYDNRAPRIFYRQFDAELEQLLFDLGTQQGARARYLYAPNKYVRLSSSLTYRKQSTATQGFFLMNASLRVQNDAPSPVSVLLNFTSSQNSSYSVQIVQASVQQNTAKYGEIKAYSRYLHYGYTGATVQASDRMYVGAQWGSQWHGIAASLKTEASFRNGAFLPTIFADLTYRFKTAHR